MNARHMILTVLMIAGVVLPAVAQEPARNTTTPDDQAAINALVDQALARPIAPEPTTQPAKEEKPQDAPPPSRQPAPPAPSAAGTEGEPDTGDPEGGEASGDSTGDGATSGPARPPVSISGATLTGADVDVQTVGSDTIIIRGNKQDVAALKAIVNLLDKQGPRKEVRVLTLEKAAAKPIAEKVQSIYSKLRPRPGEEVSLVAVTDMVVVIAAPSHLIEEVVGVVKSIDLQPTFPATATMTFNVKHRKASEAATQLKKVLDALRKKTGAEAGPEAEIIPIDANNTILITAPESEREKIQKLLDAIDADPTEGWGDILLSVFPLRNSKAEELAKTIKELIATQAAADKAKPGEEPLRRLRMVIRTPDGEKRELPPLDLEKPLRLIPDKGTESLIVATVESNVEPINEIVRILDGVPGAEEIGVKVFHLRYADAESVSKLLDDMFKEGKDLPKGAGGSGASEAVPEGPVGEALVYNVAVVGDLRTNTLMIAGKAAQIALVTSLVQQIDVPSAATRFPLRLVPLTRIDATKLSKMLEELFKQRGEALGKIKAGDVVVEREKVFLAVDVRSNSLIVAASEDNYHEIVEIAQKLDTSEGPQADHIRIINCVNTLAGDLAAKIDELWKRKADQLKEGKLPALPPVIVADQRSNALVIASSVEDFEEIQRLVDQLEGQPVAPTSQIHLITLKNNDGKEISDMVKKLFEERAKQRKAEKQKENPADQVAVANDSTTNTLLVACSKPNFEEIKRIVEALDAEPGIEGVVKFYVLKNAEATAVQKKLDDLFKAGIYTPSKGLDSKLTQERLKVTVVADARSNAIIASASKMNLAIIDRMIELMDTEEVPLLKQDTKVFALGSVDALKLAKMLEDYFEGLSKNAPDKDLIRPPTIIPDERSNSLFVTGVRDSLKRCEDLITRIEEQGVQRTAVFEIYPLEYAAAASLAEKIQEAIDKRTEGGDKGKRTPVYIMADESTNSLICSAAREDHEVIASLLTLLDKPSNIAKQFEMFPLKIANAEALAERLDNLFKSQAKGGGGGGGRADVIAVEPDQRTNSLIVWAAPSQMDNVREIVAKLDTREPTKEMQMRVIRLKHAVAEDFSDKLKETLFGQKGGGGGGKDEESVILSFKQKLDDGNELTRKLLRQDISITGDARTNALLVMAPAESIEMLEQLIREIDKMPPQLAEIRLFPLANADAEELVDRLKELFEPKGGGGGKGEMEQQLILGAEGGGAAPAGAAAMGEGSSVQGIRFAADRRTNTVIAAGGEADLNMIEKFVQLIDAQTVDDRINKVYLAKYSTAKDLTTALKDFVDEENDRLSKLDDQSSLLRQAERHVTIIGDEASNSVLLGVSPRYQSTVMEMVRQIDRPPPQVMIQVLIAEVTLNDSVEFGMEFALQDLTFTESAVIGPNEVVKGRDFDFVGGTDVGAAGTQSGFSFSITGEDFNFLLHALQTDGVLQVLSRPTILVENNEKANITIGDRVPFVTSSSVSDSGQVNSQVQYEDVGIKLEVEPHINPDGYVNLVLAPEISGLNQAGGVKLSEGLIAPTFSKRSAETVVTVKDGETVVIGGLITSQESVQETKVPIVGDIPGLGLLFRATQSQRRRSELLIVLTVDVVRDEYDAYQMSLDQRDKSGLLTPEILTSPLMEGLRILPEDFGLGPKPGGETGEGPASPRQRPKVPEDRDLYGPTPDVYGPTPPVKIKVQQEEPTGEIARLYGPALPARLAAAPNRGAASRSGRVPTLIVPSPP